MSLYVDIEKRLGAFHLRAQLEAPDETMALLGASGCGKSMTLKCIAGIVTPDRGRIVLGDRVLFDSEKHIDLTPQQRRVGYLFQQYALFPTMTVEQNILCGIRSGDRAEKRRVLAEKLRLFRLEGLEKKHPAQLSGGQQQRVALARILCAEPEAILLDEPFSALDSYLKWNLETELSSLLAAFKGPILWASHDLGECYRNCRTVCVMEEGRTCAVTDMETLARHPFTQGAARLAGYRNFLPARRCDGGGGGADRGHPRRGGVPAGGAVHGGGAAGRPRPARHGGAAASGGRRRGCPAAGRPAGGHNGRGGGDGALRPAGGEVSVLRVRGNGKSLGRGRQNLPLPRLFDKLVTSEQVTGVDLVLDIIETAVIAVGDDGLTALLERGEIVHNLAAEEGRSVFQSRFVDDDGSTLGLDALHDPLNGGLAEIVGVGLHGQAVHADHAGLFRPGVVLAVLAVVVVSGHLEHTVGNKILAGAVGFHDGPNQVLRHVRIVGQQLFGVLGQASTPLIPKNNAPTIPTTT